MKTLKDRFPWGHVVADHQIGPYTLREYYPRVVDGVEVTQMIDNSKTMFHGYIDGKDAHESWNSLEEAMVGLIVRRFLGANSSAVSHHFMAGLYNMKNS
jgi:hypothetical protein